MADFKSILIDIDVYRFLENNREKFDETHNDILKRLIIQFKPEANKNQLEAVEDGLVCKGIRLKNGLQLQKRYRGKEYLAEVKNNRIEYNGKHYYSPSAVAMEICGINVNGWNFWKYYDDIKREWIVLNELK